MTYAIVLLPDVEVSQQCVDASMRLSSTSPSLVTLDANNSLTHVTVVHFDADAARAQALWNDVTGQLQATELESIALYLRPIESVTWVGVDLKRTLALVALHNTVIDACKRHSLNISSEHADEYRPHITLGGWPSLPSEQLPLNDIPFGHLGSATPALAVVGKYGVISEVIS